MLRSNAALRKRPSEVARPRHVRNWEIHPVPAGLPATPAAAAAPPQTAACPPSPPPPPPNLGARPKCPPKPKKAPAKPAPATPAPATPPPRPAWLEKAEQDVWQYHPSNLTADELRRIPVANGGLLQPRTEEKKARLAATLSVARSLAKKRTSEKKAGESTPEMIRRLSRKAVNTIVYGMVSSSSEEE